MYLRSQITNKQHISNMKTKLITFDRFIRFLGITAICVIAYFLILRLSNILTPFFVAWLVAYILFPIVKFFQYKCRLKSRALSIVVTMILIVGIIVGGCYLIIPPVVEEVQRLREIITNFVNNDATVTSVYSEVQVFVRQNIDTKEIINNLNIMDVTQLAGEKLPVVFKFLGSSVNAIVGVVCSFIAVIYMFFILSDYEHMNEGFFNLIPKSQRTRVSQIFHDVENGMNAYFRGQTIIAMCVGVLFAIGFVIIDFPLAIPLGLFIGMLNLVPYLQTVGFLPTIIFAMLKAHDCGDSFWWVLLQALIVFAVVQAIQDWVITPRIMGKVTGLNGAVILLSLSIWGSLLGFIGLIIALPLTTLIISYYKRYILEETQDVHQDEPQKEKQSKS